LEANPDVLNDMASSMGVDMSRFAFQDVFGLDAELLAFINQPVLAVILLYPLTDASEASRLRELERCPAAVLTDAPEDLFYMKQTIGNACGTIALVHCLANVSIRGGSVDCDALMREQGEFLDRFMGEVGEMTPEEIGSYMEAGRGAAGTLETLHAASAQEGSTNAPGVDEEVNLHFVAFVEKGGGLWELDGRRAGPIRHGEVDGENFMHRVAEVVKEEYVEKGNGSLNFNLIALARR
jgi:ubiquitin carboxyl-terminal hydrolase L3